MKTMSASWGPKRLISNLLRLTISVALLLLGAELVFAVVQRHVMPGGYKIPARFQAVSLSQVTYPDALLPAARNCLSNWARVKAGDRLRIVTDDSIPSIVEEAFQRAAFEKKVQVSLERVPMGDLDSRDMSDLDGSGFDATLLLAFFPESKVDLEDRFVRVVSVPELLATDWAQIPLSVMGAIARETQRDVERASVARIRDRAGTDLSFSFRSKPLDHDSIQKNLLVQYPPTLQLSLPVVPEPRTNGWVATHTRSGGFFPLGKFQVAKGNLITAIGGGTLGERLKATLYQPRRQVRFSELRLSTAPQALRYNTGYSGSTFRWGHLAGTQRAGVATLRFETVHRGQPRPEEEFGLQVFFPTLSVGNQNIVQEGYLRALEHPRVVQLAASMGVSQMLLPQCGAESLPRLPDHVNPTIEAVTASDAIRPSLESLLENWIRPGPEESILLLSDDSVPGILFAGALEVLGTRDFEIADLTMPEAPEDAVARVQAYAAFDLPDDIWEQMSSADLVIALSHFPYHRLERDGVPFQEWLPSVETRFVAAAGLPEIYVTPWGTFPVSLLRELARYTYSRTRLQRNAALSTGEGTDLAFQFQPIRSIPTILPEPGHFGYHAAPANQFFSLTPSRVEAVDGILIARQLEGLSIPRMVLSIENGKISAVEGDGETADWLRQSLQESDGFQLKSVGTYVNPKAFPWESAPHEGWTPSFWAASGHTFRSGIIQVEFGGVVDFSLQFGFATLEINGKSLVGRGQLLTLEDPNLRSFANREGVDPADWLSEDWIPQIGGGSN